MQQAPSQCVPACQPSCTPQCNQQQVRFTNFEYWPFLHCVCTGDVFLLLRQCACRRVLHRVSRRAEEARPASLHAPTRASPAATTSRYGRSTVEDNQCLPLQVIVVQQAPSMCGGSCGVSECSALQFPGPTQIPNSRPCRLSHPCSACLSASRRAPRSASSSIRYLPARVLTFAGSNLLFSFSNTCSLQPS